MSSRLTLLFLCHQVESHSLLLSAFSTASFQLLVAQNTEDAKSLLSRSAVDAIVIWDDGMHQDLLNTSGLKMLAANTPIFLFRNQDHRAPRPLGIDSICHVDSKDEILVHAAASFFRQSLIASHRCELVVMPEKTVRNPATRRDAQVAV
jgi:hypothetical protein